MYFLKEKGRRGFIRGEKTIGPRDTMKLTEILHSRLLLKLLHRHHET